MAGRQIADPYAGGGFWLMPFNGVLAKRRAFGRLVSAPTDSKCLAFYLFNQISLETVG